MIFNISWLHTLKENFMASFHEWGSTASGLQSHYEESVYFLLLSSQKFLVLILSTLEGWNTKSTLKPSSGFEFGWGPPNLSLYIV